MKLFDRQKKWEINLYSYYDHAGIVRHLEDMARSPLRLPVRLLPFLHLFLPHTDLSERAVDPPPYVPYFLQMYNHPRQILSQALLWSRRRGSVHPPHKSSLLSPPRICH